MAEQKDFQNGMQRISGLVRDLETIADPAARAAAKEFVQLLMDMHGRGLERILEIVFQFGETGARLIDDFGRDTLVSSLLVLYGIHPEDLQSRVEKKLQQIRSQIYKMGAEVTSVRVSGSDVRLQVSLDGHSCGSTARTVQATLEEAIYDAAPDLTSLVVEGLDEKPASGFVGVEKLLGTSPVPLPLGAAITAGARSDGMD